MTISDHVARYVAIKQRLGYEFTTNAEILASFARFAEARDEDFLRADTALQWAATAPSRDRCVKKLHIVHALATWLYAEDTRHEVPRRDAFGPMSWRRPPPHPLSIPDIQALLSAALAIRPAGTITPLTWHHMFGLIAATGIRISEALALVPGDITVDGLVIRDTKFRKSRMVALHPTTRGALERYLVARRRESTPLGHLFVLATGRPPSRRAATKTFRKLAEQTGLRDRAVARGPTPHSLRHAFAVRSLENLARDADPSRHMLALATYLGHCEIAHTYWYLEATPVLLRGIAEATERTHRGGTSDD